jgi:hypothetical protein
MALTVIYDACVLYPAPLRDLFMRVAAAGLVHARWSEKILDECFRSIARQRPDLSPETLRRTRTLMNEAVADAIVPLDGSPMTGVRLPDPDDHHVVAAALQAGVRVIVTFNLRDFPSDALQPFGIEALHPDDFIMALLEAGAADVMTVVNRQAAALKHPPRTTLELLDTLHALGLTRSVEALRRFPSNG